MTKRKIKIELTPAQLELILSLCAIADVNDTSDGDYMWDAKREKLFDATQEIPQKAAANVKLPERIYIDDNVGK